MMARRWLPLALVGVVAIVAIAVAVRDFRGEEASRPFRGLVFSVTDPHDFAQVRAVVWRARPDGTRKVLLAAGYAPRLSPDGRWIAFLRKTRLPRNVLVDLYVARSSGRAPRRIRRYTDLATLWSAEWAPDSNTLLLAERDAIAAVDRYGSRYRTLFRRTEREGHGAFSIAPDSSAIALEVTSLEHGKPVTNIESITLDGVRRRLTSEGRSAAPLWGPNAIAFTRRRELWLMRPDGTERRRLRAGGEGSRLQAIEWAHDGHTILAQVPPVHNGQVWVVDARTGHAWPRTGWVGDLFALRLDRAGRHALLGIGCGGLVSPRGHIERIDLRTGRRKLLVDGPCRADWNA
jgi:hypothetical protein